MKTSTLLTGLLILLPQIVMGNSVFSPFREGQSNYVSSKSLERSTLKINTIKDSLISSSEQLLQNFDSDPSSASYDLILDDILNELKPLVGKQLKFPDIKRTYILESLKVLRDENVIDDAFYRLVKDFTIQKFPLPEEADVKNLGPALSIKDYIVKKSGLKDYYEKLATIKDDVKVDAANPFPMKDFKVSALGRTGLSVRERNLYLYSPKQIKEMAQIIDLSLRVADAEKMYTTVEFRDHSQSLVINHSPTDQYRFSIRLLRMKKREAEGNPLTLGVKVDDIDMIGAAYEMGIISYDEISLISHNKDFYTPTMGLGKKIVKYITDLGLLALRVSPVTAGYAIIPMMMYNSYMQNKKLGEAVDENSFFFTLPEKTK